MRGSTCICRPERLPARFGMRPVDGQGVRPQELGPICLAKRVQGATCFRRQEHLHASFGMRLVDEHGVRPQELRPRYLDKRVQGATCVLRPEYLAGSSGKLLCVGNGCVARNITLEPRESLAITWLAWSDKYTASRPPTAAAVGPCPSINQISRTPRPWKQSCTYQPPSLVVQAGMYGDRHDFTSPIISLNTFSTA